MIIQFYEKPGCINNTRQKLLLESCGHTVFAHSILTEEWTNDKLRPYFGSLPVNQWFNIAAPGIKSGEIDPTKFNEITAIEAMLTNHLLIRRPLIEANGRFVCGFDNELLNELLNHKDVSHLQTCPNISHSKSCD